MLSLWSYARLCLSGWNIYNIEKMDKVLDEPTFLFKTPVWTASLANRWQNTPCGGILGFGLDRPANSFNQAYCSIAQLTHNLWLTQVSAQSGCGLHQGRRSHKSPSVSNTSVSGILGCLWWRHKEDEAQCDRAPDRLPPDRKVIRDQPV